MARTSIAARQTQHHWGRLCLLVVVSFVLFPTAGATPPDYKSFKRIQSIAPADLAPESEWLEIWMIYVGQGDGMLIRLPESVSYDLNGTRERIDILVDGGPGLAVRSFLKDLYDDPVRVEHTVLTHHDNDHVAGITKVLKDDQFGLERIYHNGLASWKLGIKGLPAERQTVPDNAIVKKDRGLALVESDGVTLQSEFFVDGLTELRQSHGSGQFVSVYESFADEIDNKSTPVAPNHFGHTLRDDGFINDAEGTRIGNDISFDVLWPRPSQRQFRQWAYTINGNSLTFQLNYRDFSMLFTGDHNEDSEEDWLDSLDDDLEELESDVLKIPHHGSQHNMERFFDAVSPVLGVASMGGMGFKRWKHPSEEVIRWMGGSHRVYSTFIHERRFKYAHLTSDSARDALVESTHILIQTDGHWFRVVEFEDPDDIPSVQGTRRGNGTRWIRAKE